MTVRHSVEKLSASCLFTICNVYLPFAVTWSFVDLVRSNSFILHNPKLWNVTNWAPPKAPLTPILCWTTRMKSDIVHIVHVRMKSLLYIVFTLFLLSYKIMFRGEHGILVVQSCNCAIIFHSVIDLYFWVQNTLWKNPFNMFNTGCNAVFIFAKFMFLSKYRYHADVPMMLSLHYTNQHKIGILSKMIQNPVVSITIYSHPWLFMWYMWCYGFIQFM